MIEICYFLIATLFYVAKATVPTPIDAPSFNLTTDMSTLAAALTELDQVLASKRCTAKQILETANQDHRALCNDLAFEPLTNRSGSDVKGFCWDTTDDEIDYWYPQGVTTSHDAFELGTYEGHQIIINSWYHIPASEGPNVPDKGTRVTFTEWDNDDTPTTYRHVLLVEPIPGGDFEAIPIHAGGIMWYGDLLFVADTWFGLRVFDMQHIYEVDQGDPNLIGKQSDGTFLAFNYSYVMVQTGTVWNTGVDLRYSFVSLDRASTPHSMIIGEYATGSDNGSNTNIVRFPLDETTHLPQEGSDGLTHGSEAYDTHILQMQGALARNTRFWFGSSNGTNGPTGHYGYLRVWDRDSTTLRTYDWAYGSEDMSYWDNLLKPDRIWTLTEHPGWRTVLSVPQNDWN